MQQQESNGNGNNKKHCLPVDVVFNIQCLKFLNENFKRQIICQIISIRKITMLSKIKHVYVVLIIVCAEWGARVGERGEDKGVFKCITSILKGDPGEDLKGQRL